MLNNQHLPFGLYEIATGGWHYTGRLFLFNQNIVKS